MAAAPPASSSSAKERERVGSYLLGSEIGRGSFATVLRGYKAVSSFPSNLDERGGVSLRWDGRRGSLGTTGSDESKGQGTITLPHLPPCFSHL